MIGLLDDLRHEMGCRRTVTLREVPDLTTPATAGLRRSVLLLPDDWRSWSLTERRAVLAHELAHMVRGDYAAGLVARLAVVLNYYHPLVRWMAGRLQLQQEQAADAIGGGFAGGPAALPRGAVEPGLETGWTVPMLAGEGVPPGARDPDQEDRDVTGSIAIEDLRPDVVEHAAVALGFQPHRLDHRRGDAPRPGPWRRGQSATNFKGRGGGARVSRRGQTVRTALSPPGTDGVVMIRPAAAFRHKALDRAVPLIGREFVPSFGSLANQLKIDTSRPGFVKLRGQDIEWVTGNVTFDYVKKANQEPFHRFMIGCSAVRMTKPFDWLAFLRQWKGECEEVRFGGRAYYKIAGDLKKILVPNPCFFLPDDRTIVFDEEPVIRKFASGELSSSRLSSVARLGNVPAAGWSPTPSRTRTRRSRSTTT